MAVDLTSLFIMCILCVFIPYSAMRDNYQKYNMLGQSWRNRNLTTVPVDLDHRLKALDLSINTIEQLNVLNLRALEELDLSYNHLNFIWKEAFKNLFHLRYVNLAKNSLDSNVINNSQAFQHIYGLKCLDISLNNLNDDTVGLYIHNAKALEHLSLSGNSLSRLTPNLFANNKNLVSIDIENNNIFEVDEGTFEPLRKLSILNMARNNLVHICDFWLHQVTFLNLSQNSIEFFFTYQNREIYLLETLDLSYNNLLYFPVVPSRNKLKYLHLQHNKIGVLGLENSILEAKTLYANITLNTEMQNTDYSNGMSLSTLHYIDLSANHFRDFSMTSLSNLSSLKILNLSDNCLQNISCGILEKDSQRGFRDHCMPSLHHISLQNNQIEHLPRIFFDFLPKLETLILSQNYVKLCVETANLIMDNCVSFRGIQNLKHLDLEENGIKYIAPNSFAKTYLESLNLAGNTNLVLSRSSLEGLQDSLESLSIAKSNVSTSQVSLPCMSKLRILNISYNQFEDLPESFSCAPITLLDVHNNNFSSLNFLTNMTELNLIYISNNTYSCCHTGWLTTLNKTRIADMDKTECQHETDDVITFHLLHNHTIECQWEASWTDKHIVKAIILLLIVIVLISAAFVLMKEVCNNGSSIV
ncbi:transforming growth factor beta activator LRRC33-like [Brachyhypopomus gauderio]|uniref:transforming growth factor beta activator LRRC33-like n=1 Tax=Brachyhypopomus gauderio TaxID=698409 RepID=UPI0040430870